MRGLFSVEGGEAILPFVRQFYGFPSTYIWQEDAAGDIHEIHQGEGSEQGDALMPTLVCLGQHNAMSSTTFTSLALLSGSSPLSTRLESCGLSRTSRLLQEKLEFGTKESSAQDGRDWKWMPVRQILLQLCGGEVRGGRAHTSLGGSRVACLRKASEGDSIRGKGILHVAHGCYSSFAHLLDPSTPCECCPLVPLASLLYKTISA